MTSVSLAVRTNRLTCIVPLKTIRPPNCAVNERRPFSPEDFELPQSA